MRGLVRAFLLLSALCSAHSWVLAGTLAVASAGVFSSAVPTTTWSAPSTSWSFNFSVSDTPAVSIATVTDVGFDVPFDSFSYFLGGSAVATTPGRIRFFVDTANGLLSVNLVDTLDPPDGVPDTGFVFFGAQAFLGMTTSPAILTGSYAATGGVFYAASLPKDDLSNDVVDITSTGSVAPEVPEPTNLGIVAGACCCLFGWMRRG